MKWKETVKEYLTFTKKERLGVFVLATLLAFAFLVPPFYHYWRPPSVPEIDSALSRRLLPPDSASTAGSGGFYPPRHYQPTRYHPSYSNTTTQAVERFPFDPNTASADELRRLGIPGRTIVTIQRFREHGGRFRRPGDLARIYGFPAALAASLDPLITLPPEPQRANLPSFSGPGMARAQPVAAKALDVNEADSAAWEALPGIGPRLAARILNFRESLGGFYSIRQVAETFGLPDSVFQLIQPRLLLNNVTVRRLPVNTASLELLKAHPYIRYPLARAIILYRTEHGPFSSPEDLLKMAAATPAWLARVQPYLRFD